MLQAGVNAKVVSVRLGHASVKTTLDIYAEVLPAMDAEAADRFEAHVWNGLAADGLGRNT
jgi:integrase